jgi:serine/threonine protein kinase
VPEAGVVQKLSWVGLAVGEFVIRELLGEGSYSWVFKAVHADGFTTRAIKVAKPPEAVAEGGPTSCVPTDAVWQAAGQVVSLNPETEQLLCLQAKKLQSISDPGIVAVEEVSVRPGSCYYRMPVLGGSTLRRYMSAGPCPIGIFLDMAQCLSRINDKDTFGYHGDLKPENIMVTPSGVVLIDPGYFGTLETYRGTVRNPTTNCAVATTIYYPYLKPDDLLAFGLMLWETACRDHPLAARSNSSDFDRKSIGDDLWDIVRSQELEGRYYLSSILGVIPPSIVRPGTPKEIEEVLMKGLRLKLDADGKLNACPGFKNFAEFAEALNQLVKKNIRYI